MAASRASRYVALTCCQPGSPATGRPRFRTRHSRRRGIDVAGLDRRCRAAKRTRATGVPAYPSTARAAVATMSSRSADSGSPAVRLPNGRLRISRHPALELAQAAPSAAAATGTQIRDGITKRTPASPPERRAYRLRWLIHAGGRCSCTCCSVMTSRSGCDATLGANASNGRKSPMSFVWFSSTIGTLRRGRVVRARRISASIARICGRLSVDRSETTTDSQTDSSSRARRATAARRRTPDQSPCRRPPSRWAPSARQAAVPPCGRAGWRACRASSGSFPSWEA